MEIKFKLDTEKASKAAVAIAAAYGLCHVSVDTGYPQLAAANAITITIIITILYGPRPAPMIPKRKQPWQKHATQRKPQQSNKSSTGSKN